MSHNLTSNAAMRAPRLALAARHFAEVVVLGPVKHRGAWAPLPQEPWIKAFESKNLPKFYQTVLQLIEAADGDVLIAVKPYFSSYGVALLAAECRKVPVILDLDDLYAALVRPKAQSWQQTIAELHDPPSLVYLRALTRPTAPPSAITLASTTFQQRFCS